MGDAIESSSSPQTSIIQVQSVCPYGKFLYKRWATDGEVPF